MYLTLKRSVAPRRGLRWWAVLPILLVVTVPAEVLVKPFTSWEFPAIALASSIIGLILARSVFRWSLKSYRSASS